MFGWGKPSRNLPAVDYTEDTSSDDDLPFVSPKRPSVTRAGSPQLLAVPQLSDNVDEDLEQVSQTLRNIGHTKLFRQIKNTESEEEVIEGHIVGLSTNTKVKAGPPTQDNVMVDFDQENVDDSATAMDNLRSVQCPFNKADIVFWFSQLEDQLTLIGVKKQWTKKIALVRFLPPEIQTEVKSLLKLGQTAAGENIYFRIKTQLLKLYGPKPEDAYMLAKNLVLTGSPSQLGKQLVELLCPAEIKLDGCHCDRIVWGMFREKIPILIRNHLADMKFNKDTYEQIFDKADMVWNSNRSAEPQQAALSSESTKSVSNEVSAVQRSGQRNKNQNSQRNKNQGQNRGGQSGQNRSSVGHSGQNQSKPDQGQQNQGQKKPVISDEGLCRIHQKWKNDATFCAAPWGCKMKNVYKSPQ